MKPRHKISLLFLSHFNMPTHFEHIDSSPDRQESTPAGRKDCEARVNRLRQMLYNFMQQRELDLLDEGTASVTGLQPEYDIDQNVDFFQSKCSSNQCKILARMERVLAGELSRPLPTGRRASGERRRSRAASRENIWKPTRQTQERPRYPWMDEPSTPSWSSDRTRTWGY